MKAHNLRKPRVSLMSIKLYSTLRLAQGPLSTGELTDLLGRTKSTVSHTLLDWLRHGLVKRAFLNRQAWWTLMPATTERAKEIVRALVDAENLSQYRQILETRSDPWRRGPRIAFARLARTIARILTRMAEHVEHEQ